jgi:hypothetical protein
MTAANSSKAALTMRPGPALSCVLLATSLGLVPNRALAEADEQAPAAALYKGELIYLDQHRRFRVWGLEEGEFDQGKSSRLAHAGMTRLASNGAGLWATDKSSLYSWSPGENTWNRICGLGGDGEELEALVVVESAPLLVFPRKVESPTAGRTYKVPKLKGQLDLNSLRVIAHLATDTMLWMGTGQGEWGGHLVGLNLKTGKWVQHYDELHYVTGITQASHEELIVSWAMSHFGASTRIRVHKLDSTPKVAYPTLESKYYQRVVYSTFDKTLYGIEDIYVVSIKDGKPSKIAGLAGQLFEREPMAIGVSPGISALVPIAAKTLIIVPNHGLPWMLKNGHLTRLRVPAH